MKKNIYVTKPTLPEFEKITPLLKSIWDSGVLSNFGDFHKRFSAKLLSYLGLDYVNLFSNGTMALVLALQALEIKGEVITTPFTFAATSHAIYWNSCTPVFCDIDPETLCLDPQKIEDLITTNTTAILPVHVYGIPCDVGAIREIAKKHNLKVIYDAAHTFGVKVNNKSLFSYGDASIASFHATKIFNTFEGGAVFSDDVDLHSQIRYLKNFGIKDETIIVMPGINSKMNEFQAALGILQLDEIDNNIAASKEKFDIYYEALKEIDGIRVVHPEFKDGFEWNYSYFPILIDEKEFGLSRDDLYSTFKAKNIFARRYFYPLLSSLDCYKDMPGAEESNLPVANAIASKVLCLPIYPDLSTDEQKLIISILLGSKA